MRRNILVALGLLIVGASSLTAQMEMSDHTLIYEKYEGVRMPGFRAYFDMLTEKYEGTDATGWGVYQRSPTIAYRLTGIPDGGMEGVLSVLEERNVGFDEFTDEERSLWSTAWSSRRQVVAVAAPELSYVPEDWNSESIWEDPYTRVTVYRVHPSQMEDFENALKRRNELDRQVGIKSFKVRAYRGGFGTTAPVYMLIFHAEDMADMAQQVEERQAAREPVRDQWAAANQAMAAASRQVENFINRRLNELSRRAVN